MYDLGQGITSDITRDTGSEYLNYRHAWIRSDVYDRGDELGFDGGVVAGLLLITDHDLFCDRLVQGLCFRIKIFKTFEDQQHHCLQLLTTTIS